MSELQERIAALESELRAAIANRDEAERLRGKAEAQLAAMQKAIDDAQVGAAIYYYYGDDVPYSTFAMYLDAIRDAGKPQ